MFDGLRAKLARFAEDYSDKVQQARPPLPNSLNDRAQDNWEPLLAIAMTASDEWLRIGTAAALKLSGSESESQTTGTNLLSDIQDIFVEKKVDRISTAELINALCEDDEKTWVTFDKGLPITPRQLAGKLKGYGIKSKGIRIGVLTPKGYEKEQLDDAFSRYLPSPSENIRHTPQTLTDMSLSVADRQIQTQRCGLPDTKTQSETANDFDEICVANVADSKECFGSQNLNETPNPATVLSCGGVADKVTILEE